MEYWKELIRNWRPVLTAMLVLATGMSATGYVTSMMAPRMIEEFHWDPAAFAAVGSLSIFLSFMIPVAGRLADTVGVRPTALVGVIAMPIFFILLSLQNGDLQIYVLLFIAQALICILATATVIMRVVVQYTVQARGLALAIAASGPAFTGMFLAPHLNDFVAAHGWREGYLVCAGFSAVCGLLGLAFMPSTKKGVPASQRAGRMRDDYPEIVRNPAFWILVVSLFLCNLPQVIALTQFNRLLAENGATSAQISAMIASFALGTLAGRFICGVAIDRLPPQIVSAIGMGLPCIGLFLLASDIDTPMALNASVLLIGLALGAEGDLVAYLVVRAFGVRIYGSAYGMLTGVISLSSASGALLVSVVLAQTQTYVPFLIICGVAVFIGSLLFLLLKKYVQHNPPAVTPVAPVTASDG